VGETCFLCAQDCGKCAKPCGDGKCESGESNATCPLDCEPAVKSIWTCLKSKCPSATKACEGDPGCLSAISKALACFDSCGAGSACIQKCQAHVFGNSKALSLALCGLQNCQLGG